MIILKKRIREVHDTQCKSLPNAQLAPEQQFPSPGQLPHFNIILKDCKNFKVRKHM